MNTTDQAPSQDITKEDAKAMSAAYVKGATIDDLALEYGYDSRQVEAVVTKPAPVEPNNGLQADQPVAEAKKAK